MGTPERTAWRRVRLEGAAWGQSTRAARFCFLGWGCLVSLMVGALIGELAVAFLHQHDQAHPQFFLYWRCGAGGPRLAHREAVASGRRFRIGCHIPRTKK